MTNQEAFDKIWQHFVVNKGERSMTTSKSHVPPEAICAYRGDNGAKCAAGILIDDEDYQERFEGKNIRHLLERGCLNPKKFPEARFLHEAQGIHDELQSFMNFKVEMIALAKRFLLTIPGETP